MRLDAWICIMTRGGTPAPIITRLDGEFAKALSLPKVRDAFAHRGERPSRIFIGHQFSPALVI
jgi:tripartite-type tricarboxylate transporter receptor subunit TctC